MKSSKMFLVSLTLIMGIGLLVSLFNNQDITYVYIFNPKAQAIDSWEPIDNLDLSSLKNKEQILAYQKEYRDKNKEQISANDKEYREKNKDYLKDYLKEYYETNKDYYKQKYLEFKTRRENAKKVCPTFIYLTMLRKQDLQLYLTVYKQHEDVVGKTARNCTALQNMDFNLCPFSQNIGSDSEMKENCPMTKAFDLPDSFNFIRKYSEQLKQNSK